jgi:hypothetical protein
LKKLYAFGGLVVEGQKRQWAKITILAFPVKKTLFFQKSLDSCASERDLDLKRPLKKLSG